MGQLRTHWRVWTLVAVWWLFGSAVVCAAKGYPRQQDPYVNDYAGVIVQQDLQRIRTMLVDFKQRSGVDTTVLTISSINDYGTGDKSIESFAHGLFNTWRIGDGDANKGVLLLAAVKDRKVRIELGKSYGHLYDGRMKEIIDQQILPAFKQNDYSRGILQGAQAVTRVISGPPVKSSAAGHTESDWWEVLLPFAVIAGFLGLAVGILLMIDRIRYGSFFSKGKKRSFGGYLPWVDGGGSSGGGSSGGGGASGDW
jgi:uncharacterized membrane protein YgcG